MSAKLTFERAGAKIAIGARTFVGRSMLISSNSIVVGNDVLISWGVTIVDHASHSLDFGQRHRDVMDWRAGRKDWSAVASGPVTICDKAWIGFGAVILKGIVIGEGAVVGAHAIVTRDVPPWTVVAGNPARHIKELSAVA